MKKIAAVCAVITIFLSVVFLFDCNKTSYCCEDQHNSSTQCSTCSTHADAVYINLPFSELKVFSPHFLKNIFFQDTNIKTITFISIQDRPPTIIISLS
jgi:hypothetical protein